MNIFTINILLSIVKYILLMVGFFVLGLYAHWMVSVGVICVITAYSINHIQFHVKEIERNMT